MSGMNLLCYLLLSMIPASFAEMYRCNQIEFKRRCGQAQRQVYGLTKEECRQQCQDRDTCEIAQWHPPYQVWDDESRSTCFQFAYGTDVCKWEGAESAAYHPGAYMYHCDNARCVESEFFTRFCGSAIRYIYGETFEYCRDYCSGHSNCMVGQWHPPYQVWDDEPRSACFVFKADDKNNNVCPWNGAELIDYHTGARMARCAITDGNAVERCYDDNEHFSCYCDPYETIHDINMERCRQVCNDRTDGDNVCMKAVWFKPNHVSSSESRPTCFLYTSHANACECGAKNPTGGRMYSCHETSEIKRCEESSYFTRFCGNAIRYIYGQTFEYCRDYCIGNSNCMVGHWHPPYQIWNDEPRSVCFVFKADVANNNVCDWNGAELIDYHPGARMLRCAITEGKVAERCYDDNEHFSCYCDPYETIHDINMERCRQVCNDRTDGDNVCMKAVWFQPNHVSSSESRSTCFLYTSTAESCECGTKNPAKGRMYSCHQPF